MSATLPESIDAWRAVAARRSFEGVLPITSLKRLCGMLAGTDGELCYRLDFGSDVFGTEGVEVHVQAPLVLLCQRTLEPFVLPVTVDTRLGLIRREQDEAGLPPGSEPLLVAADGQVQLVDVIEDELLLAVPLVPMNPDSSLPDAVLADDAGDAAADEQQDNPFAALRGLKQQGGRG